MTILDFDTWCDHIGFEAYYESDEDAQSAEWLDNAYADYISSAQDQAYDSYMDEKLFPELYGEQ